MDYTRAANLAKLQRCVAAYRKPPVLCQCDSEVPMKALLRLDTLFYSLLSYNRRVEEGRTASARAFRAQLTSVLTFLAWLTGGR